MQTLKALKPCWWWASVVHAVCVMSINIKQSTIPVHSKHTQFLTRQRCPKKMSRCILEGCFQLKFTLERVDTGRHWQTVACTQSTERQQKTCVSSLSNQFTAYVRYQRCPLTLPTAIAMCLHPPTYLLCTWKVRTHKATNKQTWRTLSNLRTGRPYTCNKMLLDGMPTLPIYSWLNSFQQTSCHCWSRIN